MNNILCHIVGLNDDIKNSIIKILNSKDFNLSIIDLDNITQKIINDKNMNLMYNKYETIFEKSKMKGSDKSLNKKYKEIEKKMNQYWKNKFEIILKKECNKIKNKEIILLGLNIHFKNNRINVKIDCKLKFFSRLNLIDNAKKVIEYNLDNHRNEIIAGTFPLQYLDSEFLIKKREVLQSIYKIKNYESKSINSIISIIYNNIDLNNKIKKIGNLYVSSFDKLTKKINNDERIISYTIPWMSIIGLDNEDNYKKGFKKNDGFIKQNKRGSFNNLRKKCYLYEVDKDDFYFHEKSHDIKFASSGTAKILNTYYISDIYNYLVDNGVKMIK
jgi:hypothetical protein